METSIIEQLDKLRYNLLKWTTIGWGVWFATIIGNNIEKGHVITIIATFIGLLSSTIWAINLINFLKLIRELKKHRKLDEALNNELHEYNIHKSFQVGYKTVIMVTAILMCSSILTSISALLVTELILYFGVLSVLASILYYNRE